MKPLEIRVDTLPSEGREVAFRFPAGDVDEDLRERGVADVRVRGDLAGRVRFLRSGADLFVLGSLSAPVSLECVRCLEGFDATVSTDFHLTFTSGLAEEKLKEEHEVPSEALEVEPLSSDTLDLAPLVAEQFVLALPPYPLCGEECRGLCPNCGGDLNRDACACPSRAVDPRFAVLKDFGKK